MKENNRFSNLKSLQQRPVEEKVEEKKEAPSVKKDQTVVAQKIEPAAAITNTTASPAPFATQSRGGKSSNPEFTKITAYIKKATHKKAVLILMEQEKEDFSELLERLVSEWIVKQK